MNNVRINNRNQTEPDDAAQTIESFDLAEFFPYRVRVFYRAVSEAVANVYTEKYGLSMSEWRTMAVLGPYKAMSASEIVELSSMDKVSVSRAIKGLRQHGYITRDIDGDDKRRAVLRLTLDGRKTFTDLVPRVKQRETQCLDGLSETERTTLIALMERVRMNAERLPLASNYRSGDRQRG